MYNKKPILKPHQRIKFQEEKPHHFEESKRPVKEDIPREIKVPFTFPYLEVNNIGPEDILQSDNPYLYFKSAPEYKIPNAMCQTNNIYDINRELIITHNMVTNHILGNTPNEDFMKSQQRQYIYELSVNCKKEISHIMCENFMIIFDHGLGQNINEFIEPVLKDKITDLNRQFMVWFNDTCIDLNIFTARIKNPESGYYKSIFEYRPRKDDYDIIMDPQDPVIMMNMIDASRMIVSAITTHYREILDTIIANIPMVDIENMTSKIADNNYLGIPFESNYLCVPFESNPFASCTAICFDFINNKALEDLQKISEIAEITVTQGVSQFYRDLLNMNLIEG